MKIEKGKRGKRGEDCHCTTVPRTYQPGTKPHQLCLTRRLSVVQDVCRAVSAVEYCLKRRNPIILGKPIRGYRQILNIRGEISLTFRLFWLGQPDTRLDYAQFLEMRTRECDYQVRFRYGCNILIL